MDRHSSHRAVLREHIFPSRTYTVEVVSRQRDLAMAALADIQRAVSVLAVAVPDGMGLALAARAAPEHHVKQEGKPQTE